MIISAAICPHPPLLVPTVAAGAAFETDNLRVACDLAISRLLARAPEQVVIVGAETPAVVGGLHAYAPGAADLPDYDLPLPLVIGNWLLDRAGFAASGRRGVVVRADGTPIDGWPELTSTTGLLVMADGSARRSAKGPGYLDDRAEPFDAAVVKALATSDLAALSELDVRLAGELLVGGVGPLKALAGLARGAVWRAELFYDAAPYGVQYAVASWSRVGLG